jgi:hypothetical protein
MNRVGSWKIFIRVGDTYRLGTLVKVNRRTVWLKIMKGAKTSFTIKRHVKKHDLHLRFLEA